MKLKIIDRFLSTSTRLALLARLTAALSGATAFGDTVLRTIAYHQVTTLTNSGALSAGALAGDHSMMLSADGRKIVFTRTSYSAVRSNLVYTVNFDSSGLTLADMFPAVCDCDADVDISADGSRVIGWDGGLLRMANADGSNPHQVIQVNGGFQDFRISHDGTKVYFSVDRGFGTSPDTGNHEPGLYMINADGSGLREVGGLTTFAPFFSTTPAALVPQGFMFGWNGGSPFGLSGDGSRLVCFVWTPTPTNRFALLVLNTDGSGLRELPLGSTPVNSFNKVGLNADGSKVFYYLQYNPCCSSGEEVGTFNWDGSARRVLLSNYSTNQSSGSLGISLLTINADGSKLLCGDTGYLLNTDGSERLQMALSAPFAVNNLLQRGFYRAVMDGSGTRFSFFTPVGSDHLQIGTAELNPGSLGLAPTITGAAATPPYFITNGHSPVFAFSPAPTNGLVAGGGAQASILLNGIADPASWVGSTLRDDGVSGDAVKGDGIYSDNTGNYNFTPTIGPRTVRYKAELLGADGKYHATAIDTAPFFVLASTPTNPPPTIVSINRSNAPPDAQVLITGSGFDPIAGNNVILFGNILVQVISADPSGTQLVVLVPLGLPADPVAVTVSSQGQTSGSSTFVGYGAATNWLEIVTLAGLNIHGTVGQTYRIDYLSNLNNTNSWMQLTNLTLPTNPYLWVDLSSLGQPKRFYRSVLVP
jgi:hypothetical protein